MTKQRADLVKNKKIEEMQNEKKILLLSDIHIGNNSESLQYFNQLRSDLQKNLKVDKLDYLVISGDIAIKSIPEEYNAALELVDKLIERFQLSRDSVIIVPGNHDLNWEFSQNAYEYFLNNKLPKPLEEGKYYPAGDEGKKVRNESKYKGRFSNFATFYEKVHKKQYPLDYSEQGILHIYENDKIIFLALNSSWEIDHYTNYQTRASINMNALSKALDKLNDKK